VGLFLGYLLDRWLGTAPWLLLVLTVLGIVSGLLSLFRALKKEMRDEPPEP
jgi:ATP synthase protein I